MTSTIRLLRKERGIIFEGSKKNYPDIELPKWMKKKDNDFELEIEQ